MALCAAGNFYDRSWHSGQRAVLEKASRQYFFWPETQLAYETDTVGRRRDHRGIRYRRTFCGDLCLWSVAGKNLVPGNAEHALAHNGNLAFAGMDLAGGCMDAGAVAAYFLDASLSCAWRPGGGFSPLPGERVDIPESGVRGPLHFRHSDAEQQSSENPADEWCPSINQTIFLLLPGGVKRSCPHGAD